jgi:hypothetical protein
MPQVELGEVIATRELNLLGAAGMDRKVSIRIGKPAPFSDGRDYFCPFQIAGIGDEKVRYAAGIDSVQALQLVITMVGAYLFALNRSHNGGLNWEGDGHGGLGFPTPN